MPNKICIKCLKSFLATGNNQKTCGSYRKKTGCSLLRNKKLNRDSWDRTSEEIKITRRVDSRKYRKDLRHELFSHYGKKCICCGEGGEKFLTFDHINNDAYVERKEGKYKSTGLSFHLWLRKNNFPKNIQVLCWNCNCGKRVNNGICPHKLTQALS